MEVGREGGWEERGRRSELGFGSIDFQAEGGFETGVDTFS